MPDYLGIAYRLRARAKDFRRTAVEHRGHGRIVQAEKWFAREKLDIEAAAVIEALHATPKGLGADMIAAFHRIYDTEPCGDKRLRLYETVFREIAMVAHANCSAQAAEPQDNG